MPSVFFLHTPNIISLTYLRGPKLPELTEEDMPKV